ncbi:MAG: sarcosine oxidase subunit alpha family protein [Rhodospirillales bacterium]|nr:sarcosine oxidase subunit alpha family protein [Rhodospirillales bacterium]
MSQINRLAHGGRIDRSKPLHFTFNGQAMRGYAGDTLASALIANGVRLVGRSFKYHRPRGIMAAGAEEANALVQLESGRRTLANQQATRIELYEGLSATSINCWPGPNFDLMAVNSWFHRLMPAGFYYKTFMWPAAAWKYYEHFIRRAAGLGVSPKLPDPDQYDQMNVHCDVLVVGGGAAGLAAALAAGRTGARVILADEQAELGGQLLGEQAEINGKPASHWLAAGESELAGLADVTVLKRTTVFGYYDHNFAGMLETRTAKLPNGGATTRQRLWHVRAKRVVIAAGALERPLIFSDNDRPGVMLAGAVRTYLNRYGVRAGSNAVVFTNNDDAYRTAIALKDAGVKGVCVIDTRLAPHGELPTQALQAGIAVIDNSTITGVTGKRRVQSVEVMTLNADASGVIGPARTFPCDLVATSGGWNPVIHLHSHAGGKATFDEARGLFIAADTLQASACIGAANGEFQLNDCLKDGFRAGRDAAAKAGFKKASRRKLPTAAVVDEAPARIIWALPTTKPIGQRGKHFLDLQHDVTVADVQLAAREGYRSVEHTKRYTTLGMATDQGKTGNIPGMAVLAQALGVANPGDVGTTTFRPPYTPVTLGAFAGRNVGPLADPVRMTPMHHWHELAGCKWEDVGQWKRPWYYPKDGESMADAVNRECLAARNAVALLDASTLGKIDIQGPDAAEFLNRIYTNAWSGLAIGRCRYGLMLKEDGMVFDDGVTTRLGENHFLMTTTTGNAAAVLGWLEEWLQTEWPELKVYCNSVTEAWATLTLCGPNARHLLAEFTDDMDLSADAFPFMSMQEGTVGDIPARVFRISFTGESSFEVNVPASYGLALWTQLFNAGEKYGLTPYGTEAMHVLRAEKGYIIVGQETDGTVIPQDLGMQWILSKKKDFLGRRSFARPDSARGDRKQLVGLLTGDPDMVLEEGAQIVAENRNNPPIPMIGHVTSSYYSANLGRSIALALVSSGRDRVGDTVYIPMPGKVISAEVTTPVFIDPQGERLHG